MSTATGVQKVLPFWKPFGRPIRLRPWQKRTAARQRKQLSEARACYSSGLSNRESWVPFGGDGFAGCGRQSRSESCRSSA
jgi:hypothetical protein